MILLYILVERVALFLSTFISLKYIPYLGFFPYRDELLKYHVPKYIYSLANFDGVHYIQIARKGYEQYTQAYFPLYPILIHMLGAVMHNQYLVASLLISTISFVAGIYIWNKLVNVLFPASDIAKWSSIFLLTYPTSFFFTTAYTESLFLLFTVVSLYLLAVKKPVLSGLAAYAAALTRLMGAFMIIPIGYYVLFQKKIPLYKKVIALILPAAGLATYSVYLWKTTGDPLFFIHAQAVFGANRSTHIVLIPIVLYRYIKIFLTAAHDFAYFVAVIEFVSFSLVASVLAYDLYRLWKDRSNKKNALLIGLSLFSCINLLIPASSGTLSSLPRYSLLSLSFFIAIARYSNRNLTKIAIASCFMLTQMMLFGLFMQGYFVS